MRHGSLGVMAVCAGLSLAAACGGDDDAGLNGTGGASTGGASSGGASSGGSSGATSGGGTSSGGTAGAPSGGSAGADASAGGSSSGGTGGASTGGTSSGGTGGTGGANTGGTSAGGTGGTSAGGTGGTSAGGTGGTSAGGTGGGTGGGTSVGCPSAAPAPGTTCNVAGAVCCYGAAPAKPVRCVPTTLDGGGPYEWATLQSKVCCPSNPPTVGTFCDVPGDMKCCYASSAFRCDNQPNPDVWATTTCN